MKNLILLTLVVLFFACGKEDDVINRSNPSEWDCVKNELLFGAEWIGFDPIDRYTFYKDGAYDFPSNEINKRWEYDENCEGITIYATPATVDIESQFSVEIMKLTIDSLVLQSKYNSNPYIKRYAH